MSQRIRPRPRSLGSGTGEPPSHADVLGGLTVGDVMTRTLHTIDASASIAQAQARFGALELHHLLVEDRGEIVGIVSDRDVLRRISPYVDGIAATRRDEETLKRRVYQAATYGLITVRSDALVQEAAIIMLDQKISALPVVDRGDCIVGIVTRSDLLRAMLECAVVRAEDLPHQEPPSA